jgi:hypothetical protein
MFALFGVRITVNRLEARIGRGLCSQRANVFEAQSTRDLLRAEREARAEYCNCERTTDDAASHPPHPC